MTMTTTPDTTVQPLGRHIANKNGVCSWTHSEINDSAYDSAQNWKVSQLMPMEPTRWCLLQNWPPCSTQSCMLSAINSRQLSIMLAMHVCHRPTAARCCQHQTTYSYCLYRNRWWSMCHGKSFKVQSLGQSSREKYSYVQRYHNSSKNSIA